MAQGPIRLPELPQAFTKPSFHAFMAQLVVTCGCGNKDPMLLPFMSRTIFSVTCGVCRRVYSINSFQWRIGMEHPNVDLGMKEPDILLAGSSVAKN